MPHHAALEHQYEETFGRFDHFIKWNQWNTIAEQVIATQRFTPDRAKNITFLEYAVAACIKTQPAEGPHAWEETFRRLLKHQPGYIEQESQTRIEELLGIKSIDPLDRLARTYARMRQQRRNRKK